MPLSGSIGGNIGTNTSSSVSHIVAERSRDALRELVQKLLESNHDISRRLQSMDHTRESESILTCFRNGSDVEVINGAEKSAPDEPHRFEPSDRFYHQYSFEIDLDASRVYKRTQSYESDTSFTGSAVRTHAWSVLSGLSLSQISLVSAIALPVYSYEIFNSERYRPNLLDPRWAKDATMNPEVTRLDSVDRRAHLEGLDHFASWTEEESNIGRLIINQTCGISTPRQTRQTRQTKIDDGDIQQMYKLVVLGERGVGKTALVRRVGFSAVSQT